MTEIDLLSTVRVIKQPENQPVYLEGVSGFIEKKLDTDPKHGQMYLFHAIDLSGNSAGQGAIPANCLVIDQAPHLSDSRDRINGDI